MAEDLEEVPECDTCDFGEEPQLAEIAVYEPHIPIASIRDYLPGLTESINSPIPINK